MRKTVKCGLLAAIVCLGLQLNAQTNYDVVIGTDNVDIEEVSLTVNGTTTIQTSGASSTTSTSSEVLINYIKVDSSGTTITLDEFNNQGAVVANSQFTSSTTGVGVYEMGSTYPAPGAIWESAMNRSTSNRNALCYLYYDPPLSSIPSGYDFDVRWTKAITNSDFLVIGERFGNSTYSVTPLDSNGNPITSARTLTFGSTAASSASPNGNTLYDWNTGYAPSNYTSQPMYFTVVDVSLFNSTQPIYGYRVDNGNSADIKVFGVSTEPFDDNPNNPKVGRLEGSVVNDGDALEDNAISGTGINTLDGNSIYVNLIDSSTNEVYASVLANADGSFAFAALPADDYHIILTNSAQTVGSTLTTASMGSTIAYAGEGMSSSNDDGTVDGMIRGITVNNDVTTGLILGLNVIPETDNQTKSISSPGLNFVLPLTTVYGAAELSGSDDEDGTLGTNSTFAITSLPTNSNELWYDGTKITVGQDNTNPPSPSNPFIISNYDASKLEIKFTGSGSTSTSFNYASIDEAMVQDPSPATYTLNWPNPVPVELISFTARMEDGMAILEWRTASEINNDRFEIQRKQSTTEQETIGVVAGAGMSNEILEYRFEDVNVPTFGSTIYYRLRQVDYNGTDDYTDWILLNTEKKDLVTLFPNPASSALNLDIDRSLIGETLRITDLQSRVVFEVNIDASQLTLDISKLTKGIYYVNISGRSTVSHQSLIVTH